MVAEVGTGTGAAQHRDAGSFLRAVRFLAIGVVAVVVAQSFIVVEAKPGDLVTGVFGMADFLRRSWPPAFQQIGDVLWPAAQSLDIAIFGTFIGILLAVPMAVLAAANITPHRVLYVLARGIIGVTRSIPDIVWGVFFVTSVGLGPFPGGLAIAAHSLGMMGRLFAETIEQMDMRPIEALSLTGATRLQVFSHGVVPQVLPSLLGIALFRLDENFRSSLVLGFVGAGGIGFHLQTHMSLFDYRAMSLDIVVMSVIVIAVERFSAFCRTRLA